MRGSFYRVLLYEIEAPDDPEIKEWKCKNADNESAYDEHRHY
jgi:hypothetical protein